ncbi:hypothetical protein BV898_15447 [Hypsibius exemplaris]|uniref:Peptidase S1 domain-containing protein n=1 Tax=Hypsibius exemplaris TaxID=2072580 RepID=A0A9X6RKQ8_HYPEX|nr:hypothetical protein BV898_15447 [Hypsibius exemplaris]
MQATDKPFHTLLLLGLVVFFTGNGGGAQEPFDDTDFGDLINDDGPTVAGVDQRRSTSKPAANVDDMQAGDGDYGDYTVDDDAVIANGSVDEAIQPNATISPVFVNAAGDSGGPLFRQLPSRNYQLIGVASYVIGDCMKEGSANFFTRVSHFVTWIKDALASNRGRDRQRPSQPPSSSSATGCRTTSENGMTCRVCNNGYRYSKECSGSYSSSWSSSSSGSRFSSTCVSRSCNPFARRFYGWLSQL